MSERPPYPTERSLAEAREEQAALRTHVAYPGRVQSYNASTQTADVVPLIRQQVPQPDGSYALEELPVVPSVPVVWPRVGGWFVAMALVPGDTVQLVVNTSAIGHWRAGDGSVTDPGDLRRQHLSHAVAIPGLYVRQKALQRAPRATGEHGVLQATDAALVIGSDADAARITFRPQRRAGDRAGGSHRRAGRPRWDRAHGRRRGRLRCAGVAGRRPPRSDPYMAEHAHAHRRRGARNVERSNRASRRAGLSRGDEGEGDLNSGDRAPCAHQLERLNTRTREPRDDGDVFALPGGGADLQVSRSPIDHHLRRRTRHPRAFVAEVRDVSACRANNRDVYAARRAWSAGADTDVDRVDIHPAPADRSLGASIGARGHGRR